jgi:uncharacterized protein YdeI (YjbR/CyaY-like superfamily)
MDPKENAFFAENRSEWRKWLAQNSKTKDSVWLIIYHKKTGVDSIYYDEAVEEALCFGWIDSKPNKRDQESYYLFFAKRKPKSNWSKANRERVDRMMKLNQMTPEGLKMVELAKETGTWLALTEVQDSILPEDLKKALAKNKVAKEHFEQFPPSSKRIILEWILNAKKEETRLKRITQTVELAAKGIKANHYRQ